jgi:two-component system sensor kinase FixL
MPNHQTPTHALAEGRWRAIIDSAVDGIVVIDARGLIEAFNPAAERMFGYSEAEAIGRNVTLLMPSPYREEHDGYIHHYLETGEKRIIGIGREVSGRRRDGTVFPVHLSVGEFMVDNERHFTGILHDLSVRAELEEQLRERTALARLGEMAAVIAHEVKNPLTAVRGAIQVVGGRLPAESKDAPIIREIIARLDALNDLLKDLLLFARTPQPKLAPVKLDALLSMVADLLSSDPSFDKVIVEVTGETPLLMADAELLKIVFQNLFINAAQAMKGEGRIRATVAIEDGVQHIEIADTGPGIPPDVWRRLFRPFYTTKARGTGLGLSTAKRLVELHHGRIAVACPPGGGTTVSISLPGM